MDTAKMERIVLDIAKENGWELKPFEDFALASEELGEVAREIRRFENGRQRPDEVDPTKEEIRLHLAEEIGDVLFPLIKIAAYYKITLAEAFNIHLEKMKVERKYVGGDVE